MTVRTSFKLFKENYVINLNRVFPASKTHLTSKELLNQSTLIVLKNDLVPIFSSIFEVGMRVLKVSVNITRKSQQGKKIDLDNLTTNINMPMYCKESWSLHGHVQTLKAANTPMLNFFQVLKN